jgi:hypothetical protein
MELLPLSVNPFELIGIAASILICVSLCMTHIRSLRIVNLAGCIIFVTYGIIIGSLSIILTNSFSAILNIYFLFKMRNETARADLFDLMFVNPGEDELVRRFVLFHASDIAKYFPSFNPDPATGTLAEAECCFILRETLPVSLVGYKRGKDDEITILLDYAVPAYRDLKSAEFFFNNMVDRIAGPGTVFVAKAEVPSHGAYLKRIGFTETEETEGGAPIFRRAI